MNFSSDLQASTVQLIINLIHGHGLEHFFGGSRRFGFELPSSDVDILVFERRDLSPSSVLVESLFASGLPFEEVSDHNYSKHSTVYEVMGFVHIILFNNWEVFLANENDHREIEKKIRANPTLIDLARELKHDGLTGSHVYDLFLRITR